MPPKLLLFPQALQHVGEHCTLGIKKDLCHIDTAVGWLMLPALWNVTEKQIVAMAHTLHLEEKMKLERDMCLQADNKDTLGRQF